MNKKNNHGYNNGEVEICTDKQPNGFNPGRLLVSEETRQKHRDNNGMHNLTDEQKSARNEKIHQYNLNRTEEQKRHKSEAISKAKKGKYKGSIPGNKNKKGVQIAGNKNKKGYMSDDQKKRMLKHQHETKRKNNSFHISKAEDAYYQYLCSIYSADNVIRQYSDERYPFSCDFYIPSEDLFIEFNKTWTHGYMPFNPEDVICQRKLEAGKEKAKTSKYYQNAIYTGTDLDVRKLKTFKTNNLNYQIIY